MALQLKEDTFFLHLPKTGGISISNFLNEKKLVLKSIDTGEKRNTIAGSAKTVHRFPDKKYYNENSKFFLFIRNPLTWYKSLFIFKQQTGKTNSNPKERLIKQNPKDINDYINSLYSYCKKNKTNGLLTEYFEVLYKKNVNVLYFENFNDGVKEILKSCAPIDFEEYYNDFLGYPKFNTMNKPDGERFKKFKGVADLNEDSVNKIKDIDYPIMNQFYQK